MLTHARQFLAGENDVAVAGMLTHARLAERGALVLRMLTYVEVRMLTYADGCTPRREGRACLQRRHLELSYRCSVYLLYWYESTNIDP